MRLHEIEDNIEKLLLKYFVIKGNYKINTNGFINVDGSVRLRDTKTKLRYDLPVRFDQITKHFQCGDNQLTTLQGAPNSVGGNFSCDNNQLTTLQGAPNSVGEQFSCNYNFKLTSLEKGPITTGDYNCINCKLTSLIGAAKIVAGYFSCINNPLESLDGLPEEIHTEFWMTYNSELPILKLLLVKHLKKIIIMDDMDENKNHAISHILNKYLGQGRGGVIQCAAELTKAGFKENARL